MTGRTDVIVGIDLGTTHSLVAVCDEAGPRVLLDAEGRALLPSVVRYIGGQPPVVGHAAREHAVEFATDTLWSTKRYMGRGHAERTAVEDETPFEVVEGPRGLAAFRVGGAVVLPQQVAAQILGALKRTADAALGAPVTRAVITVPAYFDDAQRQATRDAARLAGLEAVRILNEPTAAALAYGLGVRAESGGGEVIAVYDFGGGTFDISILQRSAVAASAPGDASASGTGGEVFQVLATAGDTRLGGDDIDNLIIRLAVDELRAQHGAALEFPPSAQQALRTFAERAKIALTERESTVLEIQLGKAGTYRRTLTREELERLMQSLIGRTVAACRRAMTDAGNPQIQRVVLVGGSTRIPAVRRAVQECFGLEPYTALDPDQVVALGAAVQASVLQGTRRDLLLVDVVPLSLGIETVGGAVAKLVMRNSSIPTRAHEMFSTSVDGQANVKIHVVQGEREMVEHCRSIGRFELRGVPPMPAGIPQIQVEFLVDENGVLQVTAVERRSGKRAGIQVVPTYGLTAAEVDRMEAESVHHAREDMHRHRVVDLAVNARLDVKWIEEALARVRGELPEAYVEQLEGILTRVRGVVALAEHDPTRVDADAFHAAKEELDRASMRVHEAAIARSLRE